MLNEGLVLLIIPAWRVRGTFHVGSSGNAVQFSRCQVFLLLDFWTARNGPENGNCPPPTNLLVGVVNGGSNVELLRGKVCKRISAQTRFAGPSLFRFRNQNQGTVLRAWRNSIRFLQRVNNALSLLANRWDFSNANSKVIGLLSSQLS